MGTVMHRDRRGWRALEAVFSDLHPSRFPCRPDQPEGTLLWGAGNVLGEDEFAAVATAAKKVGDTSLYLVFLEEFPEYPDFPDIEFTVDDPAAYHGLDDAPWWSETALSSPTRRWGMLCRLDWHSVVTGPVEFIATLNEVWPLPESERVAQFLGTMEDDGVPIAMDTWPGQLLRNVYGDDRARAFIDAANW